MRGGLEASSIERLTIRYDSAGGRKRQVRFIAKELEAGRDRERRVYESVAGPFAPGFAPRLWAAQHGDGDRTVLLLEAIPRASAWPWSAEEHAIGVLERAAELHMSTDTAADAHSVLADWDYDAELEGSALTTLEAAEGTRRHPDLEFVDRALPAIRRTTSALASTRRQLRESGPFGATVLHGDLHPGNVLLRRSGGGSPVLIDWGRSRVGSPFEDVSSWLHSLGSWEPEARRRHDTWLGAYLAARGSSDRIGATVREALWLAGASNALAGALRFHIHVATSDVPRGARAAACRAAYDWCRIIRRADACSGSARDGYDRRIAPPEPNLLRRGAP